MEATKEQIYKAAKQLLVLEKIIEKTTSQQANNLQNALQTMDESLKSNRQKTHDLLENSEQLIKRNAENAIKDAVQDNFAALSQQLNQLCKQLNDSSSKIHNTTNHVSKLTKIQLWALMAASIVMSLTIAGVSFWYANTKRLEVEQLKLQYESIAYRSDLKNAINGKLFALCGNKLCVKTTKDSPRYGNDNEYIIVE